MKLHYLAYTLICGVMLLLSACGGANEKKAKLLIERDLVDPSSVEYRQVKSFNDGTVCGEFNAKNRMGGYTGFQEFVYYKSKLVPTNPYKVVLCTDDLDKEKIIRGVVRTFTTTKDHEACMNAARANRSGEFKSDADFRREESRLADSCPPVTAGF